MSDPVWMQMHRALIATDDPRPGWIRHGVGLRRAPSKVEYLAQSYGEQLIGMILGDLVKAQRDPLRFSMRILGRATSGYASAAPDCHTAPGNSNPAD